MKQLLVLVVVLGVLAGAGFAAYRAGFLDSLGLPAPSSTTAGAPAAGAAAGPPAAGAAGVEATGQTPESPGQPLAGADVPPPGEEQPASSGQPGTPDAAVPSGGAPPGTQAAATDAVGRPLIAPLAFDGNVALIDFGGAVEAWTTTTNTSVDQAEIIDGRTDTNWFQSGRYSPGPGEIVLSFFGREPAVVDRIVLKAPRNQGQLGLFPKDVEVWVSTGQTPDDPFQKVASGTLAAVPQEGEATLSFPPVEARFLKLRALSTQSGAQDYLASELKVIEARRPGYVPLMERHPELGWAGGPNGPPPAPAAARTRTGCAPASPPAPPGHGESRRVLLLGAQRGMHLAGAMFDWRNTRRKVPDFERRRTEFTFDQADVAALDNDVPMQERGVLTRARFRLVSPNHARPAILAPAYGYDTVVMAQMCNHTERMGALSPAFKQALMAWVAAGHKLIIQDSDDCVPGPDYGFIPFEFKTNTPGARGAPGFNLRFVEANQMLQGRAGRPGHLDVDAWVQNTRGYRNELGDANTFVAWDDHWCGQLAVKNVNNVTGFALAYARYGRGLIIYDGFDNDQNGERGYDQVVIRELSQPFDPDGLPCAARLGDFVLTTDSSLLHRAAVPGRNYTYPLALLSNQGYSGSVALSATPVGGLEGLGARFEPATVALGGEGSSALSLTLPGTLPAPTFAVEVKGSDAKGTTSSLCLQFAPPTMGELAVVSKLAPPTRTRKNLEIILDASGSMKTVLFEKKTRWDVALETLDQVLANLPNDFNVGLRMYGHRESSRSPRTCTDSELLVPIRKLDRKALLARARQYKPKGETPLVYSALQAPDDLKAVGGGTVILVTDGEESCKGDPVKAAADLRASGLDIRLNIVGFALKNPKVQRQLAGFAEATGGLFYSAESGGALADALMVASIDKFPYTVYDASGNAVLTGDAGSGSDQLPPGDYKVVVRAGTKEIVAPRVGIAAGDSITLTLGMKNGQLVLQ